MSSSLTIELADDVRREIERLARERGVSAEDFVAGAAAEKAGAIVSAGAYFAERAKRGQPGTAERFFGAEAGNEPPARRRRERLRQRFLSRVAGGARLCYGLRERSKGWLTVACGANIDLTIGYERARRDQGGDE